jgi:phosphate starvation-inducible PhoH-like protein
MARKAKAVELKDWVKERDHEVERRRHKKPLTERHLHYLEAIEKYVVTLTLGPAGTGKTALACSVAARMFKDKKVRRIVLSRPLVECDEQTGFLPGDLREKVGPFVAPMLRWLGEHFSPAELDQMYENETLVILPLAHMRGETFDDSFVILDEAQNATYRQLKMFLTRVGDNSRVVVCGDIRQSDIVGSTDQVTRVPLLLVVSQLGREPRWPEVALVRLTPDDVLRPDIVSFFDERLDESEQFCASTPTSATSTTPGPTAPAPSYHAKASPVPRSGSSSASSKRRAG